MLGMANRMENPERRVDELRRREPSILPGATPSNGGPRSGFATGPGMVGTGVYAPLMGAMKEGTPHVEKTGAYLLHEGEAVIPKEKNMDAVKDILGGHEAHKPAKELHEIRTRKVKGHGGKTSYIHEHHFTHPEHHKPEEHSSANQDEMMSHMMDHMGEPNPGEAEANAGQSGITPPAGPSGQGMVPGV
jgi:hypothetical protein